MLQAVDFPNLPQGRVTLAAVSKKDPEILQALQHLGIEPLLVGESSRLDRTVSSHADMRLHYLGGGKAVVEQGDEQLLRACAGRGLQVRYAARPSGKRYPQDVGLNCFALGGYLIGLSKAIDPAVRDSYLSRGFQLMNIRQGYAKCSAAVVSKNAVITADPSLAAALDRAGMECLRISPGHVTLEGHDYGFLGGACFLSSSHTLCFLGELSTHPDAANIRAFCSRQGIKVRSLLRGELRDVGCVLPLFCETAGC